VGCGSNYAITSLDTSASSWTKTSHIPTAIGALANLQVLDLNQMGLTGSIPYFARLSRLTQLHLLTNMLTGTVPAFMNKTYLSCNLYSNCNLTSNVPKIANSIYGQGTCKGNKGESDCCCDCLCCCMSHRLLLLARFISAIIAAEGQAMCEIARAFTAAGVKIQQHDSNIRQYLNTNVFSSSPDLKNWRLGYSANKTCAYNTSLAVYQPEWCNGWSGVGCDGNNKVTYLYVNAYSWKRVSHMPTAIGALTNLQSLTLSSMGLTGPIPNFAGLSRLTRLSLDGNRLTGAVPAFVYTVFTANRNRNLNLQINCNLTSPVATVAGQLYNQGLCGSGTTGTGPAALPPG
jgi:Leucine-rich repeat (LRR) protein